MTAQEILHALVAIPTPSATSNLPLLDWVARFLEAQDWRVELRPYKDQNGVAKANLLARAATAPRDNSTIGLAFVCHTDTVPLPAGWAMALELRDSLNGKLLHGCGACDVKGALACFLAAVKGLAHVRPDVALILSADEEIGCKGMDQLLATTQLSIKSAIVSEPTSLRPGIAGKGYGLARITVNGIAAHSAYPQEGLSAIALAARLITRIERLGAQFPLGGDSLPTVNALFDPPCTTVNVGTIEGGTAKNIVASECSFLVEWRPIPADPPRALLAQLEWLADGLRVEEPRAKIHVESLRAEGGFESVRIGPLQQQLTEILGAHRKPTGISFGSEASRLARIADEVIVIGPGDMHTAHSERECVPVAELKEWTDALRALLTMPE